MNVFVGDISAKNENFRGKGLLITFAMGLILMLAMRDIGGISLNKYFFFIYTTVFMCVAKREILIYMLCFMYPLLWGITRNLYIIGSGNTLFYENEGLFKRMLSFLVYFL